MSPRKASVRTSPCDRRDTEARLAGARKFLELAEVVATERANPASADGAASLAILAGIAACDAACCTALGRRSRGQNHHDAAVLLEEIESGGKEAGNAFGRMLSIKDRANYGIESVSGKQLDAVLNQAKKLVDFATELMRR
jgi:hypothetical protein